jgi:hypothetical protein
MPLAWMQPTPHNEQLRNSRIIPLPFCNRHPDFPHTMPCCFLSFYHVPSSSSFLVYARHQVKATLLIVVISFFIPVFHLKITLIDIIFQFSLELNFYYLVHTLSYAFHDTEAIPVLIYPNHSDTQTTISIKRRIINHWAVYYWHQIDFSSENNDIISVHD